MFVNCSVICIDINDQKTYIITKLSKSQNLLKNEQDRGQLIFYIPGVKKRENASPHCGKLSIAL
jgi:hypothetical protein